MFGEKGCRVNPKSIAVVDEVLAHRGIGIPSFSSSHFGKICVLAGDLERACDNRPGDLSSGLIGVRRSKFKIGWTLGVRNHDSSDANFEF